MQNSRTLSVPLLSTSSGFRKYLTSLQSIQFVIPTALSMAKNQKLLINSSLMK